MQLTQAQKNSLKAHIALNTNVIQALADSPPVMQALAINTITEIGDNYQYIANWYNSTALGTDNQPFAAPLNVWKPVIQIATLNTAMVWQDAAPGLTNIDQTNSWLKYQSMIWNNQLDMTDPQVRQGIVNCTSVASALAIGGVSKQAATRLDMLFAGNAVGGGIGLGAAARVSPVFGQKITGPDISDAILNGV